ncbi:MAG: hypothetical protein VB108_04755 [Anaerolineaceae bacterium]|nr:hypothetical protein [Anaerolineaceae bacterium]
MIAVILCTHSTLAQGLLDSAEMIIGPQENVAVVPLMDGDSVDELQEKLRLVAASFRQKGLPYCYLVDLFGASPFNACLMSEGSGGANVIAGVNLPFLLELLIQRTGFGAESIDSFLDEMIKSAGKLTRMNAEIASCL